MTDPPFGFGLPGKSGEGAGGSSGGQGGAGGSGGPGGPLGPLGPLGDPQQFADALRQFADLMSWQGGPVNWDLAKNVARQTVAASGDPSILDIERSKVVEAIRLADLRQILIKPPGRERAVTDDLAHAIRLLPDDGRKLRGILPYRAIDLHLIPHKLQQIFLQRVRHFRILRSQTSRADRHGAK